MPIAVAVYLSGYVSMALRSAGDTSAAEAENPEDSAAAPMPFRSRPGVHVVERAFAWELHGICMGISM